MQTRECLYYETRQMVPLNNGITYLILFIYLFDTNHGDLYRQKNKLTEKNTDRQKQQTLEKANLFLTD